jgi:hypothetical protein
MPPTQSESERSATGERRSAPPAPDPHEQGLEDDRRPVDTLVNARRMRWAALLQRVFEIDALRCPRCGSTMRLIAAIEDPDVARRILECMELPARAPPLRDATVAPAEPISPEDDWIFGQSPSHEEA